jgi:hypothetical protein
MRGLELRWVKEWELLTFSQDIRPTGFLQNDIESSHDVRPTDFIQNDIVSSLTVDLKDQCNSAS